MNRILIEKDDYSINGMSITKDDNDELENIDIDKVKTWRGIQIDNIIIFGDTKHATYHQLKKFIDSKVIQLKDPNKIVPVNAYRCFGNKEYPFIHDRIVHHEDAHSSFNCLLEYMHHPDYLLIYKEYKNGTKK